MNELTPADNDLNFYASHQRSGHKRPTSEEHPPSASQNQIDPARRTFAEKSFDRSFGQYAKTGRLNKEEQNYSDHLNLT